MDKIMIIGCSGAGKSTLARQLQKILGIELIHLDQYYWKANWVETPSEKWQSIVKELMHKNQWIMDGNYGGTMDLRLKEADTVIFLNFSTWLCLYRVVQRTIKYYGRNRPDMSIGCNERFTFQFLEYVYNYKKTRTPKILKKLKAFENSKQIFILENDRQVQSFLHKLRT